MASEQTWLGRQLHRLSVRLIGATLGVLLVGLFYSSVRTILREEALLSNQLDAVSTKLTADKLDTSALATGLTDLVSRLTSTGYTAPPKSKTKD